MTAETLEVVTVTALARKYQTDRWRIEDVIRRLGIAEAITPRPGNVRVFSAADGQRIGAELSRTSRQDCAEQ